MRRSQVRFLSAPPSLRSWFYAKEGHTFVVSELRMAGHIGLFFRSAYLTPVGPSPNRGPWPRAGQFHRPRSLVMGSGAQTPDWVDGAIPEYFPASQFLPAHLSREDNPMLGVDASDQLTKKEYRSGLFVFIILLMPRVRPAKLKLRNRTH